MKTIEEFKNECTLFGQAEKLSEVDKACIRSFKYAYDIGFDAAIAAIQSGELPLMALAFPIEEMPKKQGWYLLFDKHRRKHRRPSAHWFSEDVDDKLWHTANGATHYLPLGGSDAHLSH